MEFRIDRLVGGPGSAVEANFFNRQVSTGNGAWVRYHGTPTGMVQAGKTYRFSYSSIDPAGGAGNLLDGASFEIDRDADGLTDSVETNSGTYVSATNTGTDPVDDDSDNDGLKDGEEVFNYTTNPLVADSDSDGAPDGVEVTAGSDPKLASSVPKPSISSQPVATTGTVGGSASFTVTAANPAGVTAGPTYQWKKNGEDIPGETASTLTLPLLAIDSEGAYSVVVANAYGSVTSSAVTLAVNKATPVIETAPLAGTITYGDQLSAALLAGGVAKVGALEVEGFFSFDSGDFKPAAGTANQDVTFTPLDPDSYNSATLKVSVTVAKKALTVRANDQTRFYGQANPTFTVTYTGLVAGESSITPAPSVTTSANAGSLPGSYAIEVTGPAQTNYDVTFVNGTLTVRDGDQDGDGVGDSAELAAGTDPANPADRPMVLSAGWNHTLFVPVPGQTALAWGINTDGRCGLGHTNSPVTSGVEVVGEDGVTKLSNVIAVAAGGNHSLILTRSGSALQVWAAGTNGNGQLGLTNAGTDRFRPILSGLPTNITAVAAGARHSLALAADGKLYAWGDNISGQVGVNTNRTVIRMPTLVTNLGAVTLKAVRAGAEHSLALDADGKVWSWGRPNGGALGYEGISPVRAPQMVTALTKKIAQIAAGDRHSLFLTEDGEVYASGINTAAQLGLPASVTSTSIPTKLTFPAGTRIKKLVAGLNRAHAIATDGKVYAWGYNRFGELGLGFASNADPFAVFVPTEVPSLFGSTEIAGGGFQTFALDSSGTLLASGFNEGGQLGVGSTENVTTAPAPTKEAGKSDQTLTFNISALTNSTATSIVLNASATSGLTPVYTSSAPAVAAVEGSSLRFLTAGTVRITATQSGNELYNAAAPVTLQLTVVLDTTLPVVTLNGPATVSLYVGDTFADPGASALDPADGLLTDDIFVTGTVNTAVVGTYTLTYQVQDAAGNLGQAVRTVVVS
jgi:alpha-tubulin suppressor-like RCC1 family protein